MVKTESISKVKFMILIIFILNDYNFENYKQFRYNESISIKQKLYSKLKKVI